MAGSLTVTYAYDQSGGTTYVNAGATLDLTDTSFGADFSGLLVNNGTVSLGGGGSLGGSIVNNGDLSLGAGSSLIITGDYTQSASGELDMELNETLAIYGTATLDGTLNVMLPSGYMPPSGDAFELMDYGNRNGAFATIDLPSYPGGSLTSDYEPFSLWVS